LPESYDTIDRIVEFMQKHPSLVLESDVLTSAVLNSKYWNFSIITLRVSSGNFQLFLFNIAQ